MIYSTIPWEAIPRSETLFRRRLPTSCRSFPFRRQLQSGPLISTMLDLPGILPVSLRKPIKSRSKIPFSISPISLHCKQTRRWYWSLALRALRRNAHIGLRSQACRGPMRRQRKRATVDSGGNLPWQSHGPSAALMQSEKRRRVTVGA